MPYRDTILAWAEQGRLTPDQTPTALRLAGVLPTPSQWLRFLDRLLLWLSTVLLAAAVIFFFAYNWQALGRYPKFALVEVPLVLAVLLAWRFGLEHATGKAALVAAALLVGALLALVGQTYQTGADTYELFTTWALAILPWVLVGRLAALWLFWIGLINLAMILYFHVFGRLLGSVSGTPQLLWWLFGLNTTALALWETLARRGIAWLNERWA